MQRPMVRFGLEHERCCVFARMGSGKTGAMLTLVDALRNVLDEPAPLVIAPRNVALLTWPTEARKWLSDNFRVSLILGDASQRAAAVAASADLYVATYDNLQWLVEHAFERWKWRTVIADESTRLKGFRLKKGGKRAAELGRVAFTKVRRWINLTGTPYGQGFKDLWGQMWFIDQGVRLGRTYTGFQDRWFTARPSGLGGRLQWKVLEHAPAEIMDRVKDLCISIDPKDYMDLPDLHVNTVHVELPSKARHIYRRVERELVLDIERGEIGIAHAGAKINKLKQIASGGVYPAVGEVAEMIHEEKLHALRSIVEEANGMPVLVAYQYKFELDRIMKAFPEARTFNSTTPRSEVLECIAEWDRGLVPLLVLHPKSAGHGLNLQDGSCIAALYGQTDSLEEYQQFVERIGPVRQAQAGHPRNVTVHSIVARNTVDELSMYRRESGQEMLDLFIERMKK